MLLVLQLGALGPAARGGTIFELISKTEATRLLTQAKHALRDMMDVQHTITKRVYVSLHMLPFYRYCVMYRYLLSVIVLQYSGMAMC